MEEADFEVFDFGELLEDVVGYEVAAAGFGGEGELFLEPGHCGWLYDCRCSCGGGARVWRTAGASREEGAFLGCCELGTEEFEREEEGFEEEVEGVGKECENEDCEEE